MTPATSLSCIRALLFTLLLSTVSHATSFEAAWSGQRSWVGPEYWAIRWQDWSVQGDRLQVESRPNRSCVLLTHEIVAADGEVTLTATLSAEDGVNVAAGIWAGVRGPVDDWRSAAAYAEYRVFAGVEPDGTLLLRTLSPEHVAKQASAINVREPFELHFRGTVTGERVKLQLKAKQANPQNTLEATVHVELEAAAFQGLIGVGTASQPGEAGPAGSAAPAWRFHQFGASGATLVEHADRTYGPIGWTQYTCTGGLLKMTALMTAIGDDDNQIVRLLIDRNGSFVQVSESRIDPVSRTAHFRVNDIRPDTPLTYRVSYEWRGKTYTYDGTIRPEPLDTIRVAVMSCDWGYAFPNTSLTRAVRARDPDLLLYTGDQIYEHFGKFGIERRPLARASLDYLRKYHLFGMINRDLLRDRPSLIIPDDHDVYQGNIWGAGGIKQPPGGDEMGGYQQSADWINAMQRTQCWHLPDAIDPTPVEQGITVYYGAFTYGNVAFSVLEDRKWKTGYRSIGLKGDKPDDADALDPPGTSLLGDRQEDFLAAWGDQHRDLLHVAISQTAFAKAHTHSGPDLKRNTIDFDTNGWPRTPRNRAVKLLGAAGAIHLCGDQHLGQLMQLGADTWYDGPLTFMVPGTANGWPRAWWPETAGEARRAGAPEITGKFLDAFGNKMIVYAVANPEERANTLKSPEHSPETIAHAKGSGFGIVQLDPQKRLAHFAMYRYLIDIDNPRPQDQFEGFPMSFQFVGRRWVPVDP